MNHSKKTLIFCSIGLFGFFSLPSNADLSQDLINCRTIQTESARLSCYDGLITVNNNKNSSNPETLATQPLAAKIPPVTATTTPLEVAAVSSPKAVMTSSPKADDEIDAFGEPASHGLQSIQSRMIGQFKHWKKGLLLHLENGQVWKVLNSKSGYKKLDAPLITISKGFFGSFDAEVEGLNATAKVKRVK